MERKTASTRFKFDIRIARNFLLLLFALMLLIPFLPAGVAKGDISTVYLPIIAKRPTWTTPASTSVFGFHVNTITDEGLNHLVATNSKWIRRDFPWGVVEPTEGVRNWTNATIQGQEQELINAADRDISVVLILGTTPDWARVTSDCPGRVKPEKLQALGNFVYDLVQRYKSAPYNIKYWELWNEPDVEKYLGCWGIPGDTYYGGAQYADMLKVIYPRIKEADPTAQVLVGGLLLDCDPRNPPVTNGVTKDCTPSRFMEGILSNQGGAYFDGISFHGYDYYSSSGLGKYSNSNWGSYSSINGPVSLVKSQYLEELLSKFQVPAKYLAQTETAVFCDTEQCRAGTDKVYEIDKSIYVVESNVLAIVEGWRTNIWWAYNSDRGSSLMLPSKTPSNAYYTYQFTAKELGGAISGRSLDIGVGIMAYEIKRESDIVWVLWAADDASHTIDLPLMPQAIYHISSDTGSAVPVPVKQSITIDALPTFIEARP